MNENGEASAKEKKENHNTGCNDVTCCPPNKPATRTTPKVGLNDPCFCGSNRKFKKCCGRY